MQVKYEHKYTKSKKVTKDGAVSFVNETITEERQGTVIGEGCERGKKYYEILNYGRVNKVKPVIEVKSKVEPKISRVTTQDELDEEDKVEKVVEDWEKLRFFELRKYAEKQGMDIQTNTKKSEIIEYLNGLELEKNDITEPKGQ